jgi:hypothetical protein
MWHPDPHYRPELATIQRKPATTMSQSDDIDAPEGLEQHY